MESVDPEGGETELEGNDIKAEAKITDVEKLNSNERIDLERAEARVKP